MCAEIKVALEAAWAQYGPGFLGNGPARDTGGDTQNPSASLVTRAPASTL